MHSEDLTYEADGLRMVGRLYRDRSHEGARPGVLVFPEAFGLGDHAKERAERLAALGYIALACDLHGDARMITKLDEAMPIIRGLRQEPERIRARASGALAALKTQSQLDPARIAAMGFCFGGTMSLELARSGADIAGVIGFHSGLGTVHPDGARHIKGKVLALIGADDPSVPAEQRAGFEKEMREANVDWRLHVYGGVVHSFTDPNADKLGNPALRYDANADRRSWTEMRAFLDEIFA